MSVILNQLSPLTSGPSSSVSVYITLCIIFVLCVITLAMSDRILQWTLTIVIPIACGAILLYNALEKRSSGVIMGGDMEGLLAGGYED